MYTIYAYSTYRTKEYRHARLGAVFVFLADDIADNTFAHALDIILDAIFESIHMNFTVTEEQMDAFIADFVQGLPYYMQVSLAKRHKLFH